MFKALLNHLYNLNLLILIVFSFKGNYSIPNATNHDAFEPVILDKVQVSIVVVILLCLINDINHPHFFMHPNDYLFCQFQLLVFHTRSLCKHSICESEICV